MTLVKTSIEIAPNVFEMTVESRVARRAQAGQFVIVMATPKGERIPLTIADFDRDAGTITLVVMVVGTSSQKIAAIQAGESFHALIGPLGQASKIEEDGSPERSGKVVVVAGGVGTAPIYPIAHAMSDAGREVISIQGARSRELLFWDERLAAVSSQHIITTDDGSVGEKALVTAPLQRLLEAPDHGISEVLAIGPLPMMRAVAETTRPFGVHTVVSLNTIMVDGTGMCGGCRVEVGGKNLFTCVDGPEFDGHGVDWQQLMNRQRVYRAQECRSLEIYRGEEASHG